MTKQAQMNYPNILYIHSHDTGRYIQPFGHAVATPNLQRLAESGVLFRQAFCAAPTCSPSRAALLTGQCAHSSGMLGLAHHGWKPHDYKQHIIHTLKTVGFHSALAGMQHIAVGPNAAQTIGYDQLLETPGGRAEAVSEAAVQFLDNAPTQPFFLDVGFMETHILPGDSLFGCEPGDSRYVRPPASLPDSPRTRQDFADFKVAAARLDAAIGRVLDALERNGLAQSTLVISTTDHGLPLPGMKCTLTDHGIGVSLILRGPKPFDGGRVCDAMVSHIDVFPTVCDWLQIEPPAWLQGRSLLPLLRGEVESVNEQIFAEVTHHAAYQPQRAVRTQRWKYIRQFAPRTKPVMPNVDDSPSKDLWVEHNWRERTVAPEALFDLMFDPNEAHNLAHDEAHSKVLCEMRERLETWMRETDDPILRGPVPVPPGIKEKNPDDLSPR